MHYPQMKPSNFTAENAYRHVTDQRYVCFI
uniref:Uncharacterized protein n=1 Tax=Anguilla anguilla TaxID=7936 RepID=A0A0E9PN16_ANGAN